MKRRRRKTCWAASAAVAALAIAAVGVLYAHWTDTLVVEADIDTGFVGVGWWDVNCGENSDSTFHVLPGPSGDTTARPFGVQSGDVAWANEGSPFSQGGTRYTKWATNKNVAWVETDWTVFEPVATIRYFNTYPSFYDDCEMEFTNSGSIPIAVPYLVIEGLPGTTLASDIFAEDGAVWVEWSGQVPPSAQLDPPSIPPDVATASLKLHVEQIAAQRDDYAFTLTVCVHNWNEPTQAGEDVCDLYEVDEGDGGQAVSKTTGDPVIVIPNPFGDGV